MYEIWLIINTFYELAMANLELVVGILVAWLALMVVAGMKKTSAWGKGFMPALAVAVLVWIAGFVLVPSLTKSSFSNVTYFWDYLVVAGVAAGFAGLAAAFVWPASLLFRRAQ